MWSATTLYSGFLFFPPPSSVPHPSLERKGTQERNKERLCEHPPLHHHLQTALGTLHRPSEEDSHVCKGVKDRDRATARATARPAICVTQPARHVNVPPPGPPARPSIFHHRIGALWSGDTQLSLSLSLCVKLMTAQTGALSKDN